VEPKRHWRERLAELPPDRQAAVKDVIRKLLKIEQQRVYGAIRKTAGGDTLH
jgi:hypothetical protein